MEAIELKEGASVRAADGENLGRIDRFVVDPSMSKVTHLVVKKGVFFPDDRLVPVDQIDHTDDKGPVLSTNVSPAELPEYETKHYVDVDQTTRNRLDSRLGPASMWRFPTLATGMYPIYPVYTNPTRPAIEEQTVERANVPDSDVVIDEDTPVMSMTGKEIGTVAEVFVDNEGHLSHLIVNLGLLSGERVLPAHWIESIREDQVSLAVGDEALERLEQIQTST